MSHTSEQLRYRLAPQAKVSFQTSGRHHFFGYYDKCPWSGNGELLLAHETDFIDRLPDGTDAARIGYFVPAKGAEFRTVAETRAWNWQQGSMLQWLGPDFTTAIIFNDYRNGQFVSVIMDVVTQRERVFPKPVCAVSPDGRYALSINFSRLHEVREGYGYRGLTDAYRDERAPAKDGIHVIDLKSGETKLLLSLADLYHYHHLGVMDEGKHWVDHVVFNHDNRFALFHRWQLTGGRFYTRLLTANVDGSDLYLLLDTGMASHHSWGPDNQVLLWGRKPTAASAIGKIGGIVKFFLPLYRLLKPAKGFLRTTVIGDSYLVLRDKSRALTALGAGVLDAYGGGHSSFSPNGKLILTDTYPSADHFRKLAVYDIERNTQAEIGEFHSLPDSSVAEDWDQSAMRADLHPRFDRSGTRVCIDSVHDGSRQMYVVDIRNLIAATWVPAACTWQHRDPWSAGARR